MKTELTVEQSATLIECGIPKEKASGWNQWEKHGAPIFNLTDLLDLLPERIEDSHNIYRFTIKGRHGWWIVEYLDYTCMKHVILVGKVDTELIEALYSVVLWLLENGYIKQST